MVFTDFSFTDVAADLSPLCVVDVGAAPVGRPPCYQSLIDRGKARVIAFEPDQKACDAFNAAAKPPSRCLPYFVGRGRPATFYETSNRYTSSLYKPNQAVLERFNNVPAHTQIKAVHKVETRRLDDIVTDPEIDFLKIDVQGAELDVLMGAERLLPTALAVELEVEFVPLYEGQPLFAEIDAHMRANGFQLHTFSEPGRFYYAPTQDARKPLAGNTQVVWTDAVYIPDLSRLEIYPPERLLKLVTILHDFYKSFDLCLYILRHMTQRGIKAPKFEYAARINGET